LVKLARKANAQHQQRCKTNRRGVAATHTPAHSKTHGNTL
jgi:hypothetical protein